MAALRYCNRYYADRIRGGVQETELSRRLALWPDRHAICCWCWLVGSPFKSRRGIISNSQQRQRRFIALDIYHRLPLSPGTPQTVLDDLGVIFRTFSKLSVRPERPFGSVDFARAKPRGGTGFR